MLQKRDFYFMLRENNRFYFAKIDASPGMAFRVLHFYLIPQLPSSPSIGFPRSLHWIYCWGTQRIRSNKNNPFPGWCEQFMETRLVRRRSQTRRRNRNRWDSHARRSFEVGRIKPGLQCFRCRHKWIIRRVWKSKDGCSSLRSFWAIAWWDKICFFFGGVELQQFV